MKHDMMFKKTGMCFVCGKPTKLLIHQQCGQKQKKSGGKKPRKYSADFVNSLIKADAA